MLWRGVRSVMLAVLVVLAASLGGVTGAESVVGAAVKQEVEDIFRTVERFMQGIPVEKPDSKSVGSRMKEIYDSGEHDYVDESVSPRATSGVAPAPAFPIGIIMADSLYPLVVGKNVDTGRPFVANVNKQHALVVASAADGADYKLLIPFPVVMGHGPQATSDYQEPHHYQSYRQYSAEDPESGEQDKRIGKKYQPPKNVKPRPEKVFGPSAVRGYPGQGVAPGPSPPRKNLPLAYQQPQYHPQALYPPVNYNGAYASVPRDFRPSPYLGNITDDEPVHPVHPVHAGRKPKPQSQYESYDYNPDDFTEQDYIDSLNSPGAHASIGGVHHVTHHADDYLGKIYEDMYYRTPPHRHPRPNHPQSSIDRKGNQEYPTARQDTKVTSPSGSNKTEISRSKTSSRQDVKQKEVKQMNTSTNKTSVRNR